MLGVFLTVLKVIGVVLLCLLAFLLVILLTVLLVPVRYNVRISKREQWKVNGWISWFLHFVHISLYQGDHGFEYSVRIFGILLKKAGERKKKKRMKRPGRAVKKEQVSTEDNRVKEKLAEIPILKEAESPAKPESHEEKKRNPFLPIYRRLVRIYEKLKELFVIFGNIIKGIRQGGEKAGRISAFIKLDVVSVCWGKAKRLFQYLWKHSHPRKIDGDIVFGTGDPCGTGEVLGLISVCYGILGAGVHITPDFDREILEGYLKMKGRIRVFHLVVLLQRIWFDNDWRQFRMELNKLKEEL